MVVVVVAVVVAGIDESGPPPDPLNAPALAMIPDKMAANTISRIKTEQITVNTRQHLDFFGGSENIQNSVHYITNEL